MGKIIFFWPLTKPKYTWSFNDGCYTVSKPPVGVGLKIAKIRQPFPWGAPQVAVNKSSH